MYRNHNQMPAFLVLDVLILILQAIKDQMFMFASASYNTISFNIYHL